MWCFITRNQQRSAFRRSFSSSNTHSTTALKEWSRFNWMGEVVMRLLTQFDGSKIRHFWSEESHVREPSGNFRFLFFFYRLGNQLVITVWPVVIMVTKIFYCFFLSSRASTFIKDAEKENLEYQIICSITQTSEPLFGYLITFIALQFHVLCFPVSLFNHTASLCPA